MNVRYRTDIDITAICMRLACLAVKLTVVDIWIGLSKKIVNSSLVSIFYKTLRVTFIAQRGFK